jgi:hypothetical protein
MKKILYFLVFNLMFVAVASTQETLNGAFVSEFNEVLIIEDDAVAYNLLSHDAFNTHYVGLHKVSTLNSIEEKKLNIVLDTNILKTSSVAVLPNQNDIFAQISLEFNCETVFLVHEKKSEIQQREYFPEDRVLAREQAIAS